MLMVNVSIGMAGVWEIVRCQLVLIGESINLRCTLTCCSAKQDNEIVSLDLSEYGTDTCHRN